MDSGSPLAPGVPRTSTVLIVSEDDLRQRIAKNLAQGDAALADGQARPRAGPSRAPRLPPAHRTASPAPPWAGGTGTPPGPTPAPNAARPPSPRRQIEAAIDLFSKALRESPPDDLCLDLCLRRSVAFARSATPRPGPTDTPDPTDTLPTGPPRTSPPSPPAGCPTSSGQSPRRSPSPPQSTTWTQPSSPPCAHTRGLAPLRLARAWRRPPRSPRPRPPPSQMALQDAKRAGEKARSPDATAAALLCRASALFQLERFQARAPGPAAHPLRRTPWRKQPR